MKQLVKRMLRPYHLELGRVEAYESNAPAPVTTQSDTTTTQTFSGDITYYAEGDSVRATGTKTETVTVDGDTISTTSEPVNQGAAKEDLPWYAPGRAWDGVIEWLFGDDT